MRSAPRTIGLAGPILALALTLAGLGAGTAHAQGPWEYSPYVPGLPAGGWNRFTWASAGTDTSGFYIPNGFYQPRVVADTYYSTVPAPPTHLLRPYPRPAPSTLRGPGYVIYTPHTPIIRRAPGTRAAYPARSVYEYRPSRPRRARW